MSVVKKSRTAARSWATRCSNNISKVLSVAGSVDLAALQDAVYEFDRRLAALDACQEEYEVEVEDENELKEDIEKAADYREHIRKPRVEAGKLLAADEKESLLQSLKADSVSSVSRTDAKLPKLVLPHFSGDVLKWTPFWEQFEAVVDTSDMPDVTKFTYLLSLLKGEAKATVQGLPLNGVNYRTACDLLKKRFGRPEKIRFSHIQELLAITVNKNAKTSALWEMYNKLMVHVRCLEALSVEGTQYGVVLVPLVLSRLLDDLRLEWARKGEGHESDLAHLLVFLHEEIERHERSLTFTGECVSGKPKTETHLRQPSTAAALHQSSTTGQQCTLCESKGHSVENCFRLTKIPVSGRKSVLQNKPLCFKCLKKRTNNHKFRSCTKSCSKCGGHHHLLLCDVAPASGDKSQQSNTHMQHSGGHTQSGGRSQSGSNTGSGGNPHTTFWQGDPGGQTHQSGGQTQQSGGQTQQSGHQTHNSFAGVAHSGLKHPQTGHVLFQAARVTVRGESGTAEAVIIFDTGSDRSYISERLVNKISPEWVCQQQVSCAAFGSSSPSDPCMRNLFNVTMLGDQQVVSVVLTETPVVCAPMYRPAVPSDVLSSLDDDVQLIDVYEGEFQVDILIGLDVYWRLMTPDMRFLSDNLMVQRTLFGWIMSGVLSQDFNSGQVSGVFLSHQLVCLNSVPDSTVRRMWELESVGVSADLDVEIPDPVLSQFRQSVSMSEGRYVVKLPWKPDMQSKLMSNHASALKRLDSLTRKLSKDPILESRYDLALQEMEDAGIVHEVPAAELDRSSCFYMPHRPVVRESRVTTKVRPIFDCSARGPNGVSLNDCLETGPCMLASLVEILVRFRRWAVAVTADIQKAFLMIKVAEMDRDMHRFLWRQGDRVRVMRFDRVPFGNTSSPFLLMATLKHHLAKYPAESRVVHELDENMYMDDWITGADDDHEACSMFQGGDAIMSEAQFTLAKFGSSSEVVAGMLQKQFEDKVLGTDSIKVLGLTWQPRSDSFVFSGLDIPSDLVITKRVVLSLVSRLFDPLGYLNPYAVLAKVIFQDLWKIGVGWDVPVPESIQAAFTAWIDDLHLVRSWEIPRRYVELPWRDVSQMQLHAFGDSSERAYGACVYLRVLMPDGSYRCSLVMSKVKVAPLKKLTLPRLELMGSLLCARLVVFVKKALKLADDVECFCWTDSTVALCWIKGIPHKWKQFVANRVAEIHTLTSPDSWRHCPGILNPSDLVTRGISAKELIQSSMWLQGPQFLEGTDLDHIGGYSYPELASIPLVTPEVEQEVLCESKTLLTTGKCPARVLDVERWSSYIKAIRIVAWVLRYLNNLKANTADRQCGDLTFAELSVAKVALLKCVQEQEYFELSRSLRQGSPVPKSSTIYKLSPYLDSHGLLRVQGRLQLAGLAEDEKHPIIIPKGHFGVLLARHIHYSQKHAGVNQMLVALRNQFWLVSARSICKSVKHRCVSCQRQDAKPVDQCRAPLPALRVTPAPAFSVTGLDHCGPLYCCDCPGKKFYILLFTCAVVRAIHLELVESVSCKDTMLALRRFFSRRGMPSVILSDNAKGFKAAAGQMLKAFGSVGPEWKFIVPRAPWWGGFWERVVRNVKSALRKSLGRKSLTRVEFETCLHEVEACVNSRPLTYQDSEADSPAALTPSHFLIGRSSGMVPADEPGESELRQPDLRERLEVRLQHVQQFWDMWKEGYIRNLPPCTGNVVKPVLVEGSLVLISDENSYRLQWPLGVVQRLFPSRDGQVRSVEIKTAKGILVRPVQRLYHLEVGGGLDSARLDSVPGDTKHTLSDTPANTQTPPAVTPTDRVNKKTCPPDSSVAHADGSMRSRYGRILRKTKF